MLTRRDIRRAFIFAAFGWLLQELVLRADSVAVDAGKTVPGLTNRGEAAFQGGAL